MRAEINIVMVAILFVALQGVINWMGPDGYRDFIDFMFGDFIEFWRDYRYDLTPDFSQPLWLALGALGSLILLRIAPKLARIAAIWFLGFYVAQVVGYVAELQGMAFPAYTYHCFAMIALGWIMFYRALREPMFWVSVLYR